MTHRLTDTSIKNLKGPGQWPDALAPGLSLRIQTEGGAKTWTVFYRLFGKQHRMNLGRYPGVKLAEARARARKAQEDARQGIDPRQEIEARKEAPSVADLLDEFERVEGKRIRSMAEIQRVLRKDLKRWMDRKVTTITRREVVLLVDDVAKRGPGIARNFQGYLGQLMNFAAERGHVPVSPIAGLRNRNPGKPRRRVLTDDEIRTLWSRLDDSPLFPATRRAMRMILVTGQRPEEVVGMQWSEITGALWSIPPERRKVGDDPHEVPLSSLALEILNECPRDKPYLFASSHGAGHIRRDVLSRALLRYLPQWGIDPFTPHDLRRTLRTRLSALGIEEYIAERVIGHELQGMLKVYNQHRYLDEKTAALNTWSDELRRILDKPDAGIRYLIATK